MTGAARGRVALALLAAAGSAQAQEAPLRGVDPPEARPPAALSPSPGLRTMPETLSDAIGTWDLSLDGSNRRCELSLSGDSGPDGRLLRFPAGCRRALPVLAKAAGWLFSNKGIRIVDANVRPLIEFAPRPDAHSMAGQSERGEHYSLVPLQTLAMLPAPDLKDLPGDLPPDPPAGPQAAPQAGSAPGSIPGLADAHAIPGSQPVLPADVLVRPGGTPQETARGKSQAETRNAALGAGEGARPEGGPARPAPGVYALDRFSDRDVCRIALDPRPAALSAGRDAGKDRGKDLGKDLGKDAGRDLAPARILPGCRDSGIAVFDPVSWRFSAGHMTLKAKRGHAVNLVATGDGRWRRDPDVGTTFVLRKVD